MAGIKYRGHEVVYDPKLDGFFVVEHEPGAQRRRQQGAAATDVDHCHLAVDAECAGKPERNAVGG